MSAPTFPSTQGFQQISRSRAETMNDPEAIPLQKVVSAQSTGARRPSQTPVAFTPSTDLHHEKSHRSFRRGLRRRGEAGAQPKEQEEGALNSMGRIYNKILNFSTITRYLLYILPLGICLAIPIVVGAIWAQNARIGGTRIVWLFTWIEIVWVSLWVSKIFAHVLPRIFQFVVGIVSSKIRRYALMLRALELPISFIGWALCSFLTFTPLMTKNPDASGQMRNWHTVLRQILAALLICSIILFAEKFLIQVISVNYHSKQFGDKIKDNKKNLQLLSLLYGQSRKAFPEYCETFVHEDNIINDALNISKFSKRGSGKASGSATPMKLLRNVGRVGDTVTSAFGRVAQDITGGTKIFDSGSSVAVVSEALEKTRSREALARRIWMSFVCEGNEALHLDDLEEVLGIEKQIEAEEAFMFLDKDGNGDVSLDEMILVVGDLGRSIKSIASSKHDVDQALKVLDRMLLFVVLLISVLIFIALLNKSFVTTLATTGTAILSLSFVFAATAQEVLGSCIFLFVKHPYDVGDRVDLQSNDQLTVEHISLLYTVFKRINTGKLVQIPNIVLNQVWVENITRSKAMREQILLYCNFDTSFEDIEALKMEMSNFVKDPANNRDFQPEIDIQVTGLAEMNKMELRIECLHKSNWANETIRAARRSKFMMALVLAIRKVPIYGPGGGDAALGSMNAPSYSVSVSHDEAAKNAADFAEKKEAKRLINKSTEAEAGSTTGTDYSGVTAHQEMRAVHALNARSPAVDHARDDAFANRGDIIGEATSPGDRRSLEEVRGLLRRESTRGRRHQLSTVVEPPTEQTYPMVPAPFRQYAPPPTGAPQIPPIPGNAFSQSLARGEMSPTGLSPRPSQGQGPYSPSGPPPPGPAPSRGR